MTEINYLIEPLILSMQDAFIEYSIFFENDLPLNINNALHITYGKNIIRSNLDNIVHNQTQKLKIYNFLFYKLFISQKKYSTRVSELKNTLGMIVWYDRLFQSMSLCSYEEYAFNKKITPKSRRQKIRSILYPPSNKAICFKVFGYSSKNDFNLRIYALNEAINFYGFHKVLRSLKKIQYFNLCYRYDYEYLMERSHLFPAEDVTKVTKVTNDTNDTNDTRVTKDTSFKNSKNTCYYDDIVDGLKPENELVDNEPIIGELVDNSYDVIACFTSNYFKKNQIYLSEQEKTKNKIKKIHSYLNQNIII